MQILIDMNLSPLWVDFFKKQNLSAVHWKDIGKANAPDIELIAWARANNHLVFTQDLDFTHLIALTRADGPSILQVRTMNNLPDAIGTTVLAAITQFNDILTRGAIVVVDQHRARARVLPLR